MVGLGEAIASVSVVDGDCVDVRIHHSVEKQYRQGIPLEHSYVHVKHVCCPFRCHYIATEVSVDVLDYIAEFCWSMVVFQGELYEVVMHTSIGIG